MNKILFVFHSENISSGATRSLMDIVDYLISTEKYDIEAVFPAQNGTAVDYLKSKNIKVHHYTYGKLMQDLTQPLIKRIVKLPLLFLRYFKIKKQAKKAALDFADSGIDIVYSNTSSIVFGGYLGLKLGCKQIWHIREFRKKDHQIAFFLGDKSLQKFINRCSDAVLFVSKSVMNEHIKYIDSAKMYVTYNSYPKSFIRPREQFNSDKPLQVMIAGDIKPSKGQFDVIKAVEIARNKQKRCDIVLHLAGRKSNSQYYDSIVKYIQEHKLDRSVILHGQVTDMISLRDKMDVGVVASTNEAFGRTTIEGMLSMMAMVGRNSGGTTEQIKHMETGLLYDGTVEDLSEKLLFLYNNRDYMEKFAKSGFDESVELHTKGNCAKTAEKAIIKVLSS